MRYEDASNSFQASGPIANDDSDQLPAGSRDAATGNLISGDGTKYGAAGADSAAGGHITSIAGKGGEDSSFAGGKLSVTGEYGRLTVDAEGNYSYKANNNAPENVRDRFTYTLADNQGGSDTAALIIELGKTQVAIKSDAQQIVPGPDGVVTLPPGVELSDVMVVGRNLVINMPDGTQLIIVDGAVFVPQLVLDGVSVPATNVAALLIGQEPQPAAGELPPSSGGNFALPPPPLDPGVPLGDLLPPTVRDYIPPEPEELFPEEDSEPEITIQPDGQPASVNAIDSVDEKGLPARNEGEPEGSGEGADGNPSNDSDTSEATAGRINIDSPDGVGSVTINGVLVTGVVGQQIDGQYGTLTITGFDGDDILYSYVLNDNTSGDDTHDDFEVVLTDSDGDVAVATLTIDIIDDVPTARPDTDALGIGEFEATGNVITDASPGDAGDSDTNAADTVGADDASLTSVSGAGGSDSTFEGGVLVVNGQYGVLTIDAAGNYTYVKNENAPGGVQDVFNYTLTDGDGDTSSSTLTITIPDNFPDLPNPAAINLDDDVVPGANGNVPDGPDDDDPDVVGQNSVNGQLNGSGGDGDLDYFFTDTNSLPVGFTTNLVNAGTLQILQGATVVMTITLDNETGAFTVVQNNPIDHPSLDGLAGDNIENNLLFSIGVEVEDSDGDTDPATITINVDDDTPVVNVELNREGAVTVDESGPTGASTINFGGVEGDDEDVAGSGPIGRAVGATAIVDANALFGADGPSGSGLTYSLQLGGTDTPLTLTDGSAIQLQLINGVIVGMVTEGPHSGEAAFAIAINPTTGVATVEMYLSLDHPDVSNPNDSLPLGPDTVDVVVAATDGDGDTTTSDPVDVSGLFNFLDDGPSVDPELSADGPAIVDESPPVAAPTIDTGPYAKGDDPDLVGGQAIGSGSTTLLVPNAIFGADGPAASDSLTFALSVINPSSGLTLTDGSAINLVLLPSGVVVGVVSGGPFDGQAAFAISIDANTGTITAELYLSLDHPVNPDPNDVLTLDPNSLGAVVTATDGDGDTATSGVIDIGSKISFLDDGPAIDPVVDPEATVTVDESLPSTAPAINTGAIVKGDDPDLAGGLALGQANSGVAIVDANAVFGADGPAAGGGLSYALSITNASSGLTLTDGTAINLQLVGGVIVGVVAAGAFAGQAAFAISIDPSTGVVSVEQYLSLDHPANPDPNDPLGLGDNTIAVTVTATDGDGDPVTSGAIDISDQITFLDDGPTIDPVLDREATVTVDESLPSTAPAINTGAIAKGDDPDLAGGLALGQANSGSAIVDANAVFGADGPAAGGGISYALSITNVDPGVTLTDGTSITMQLVGGVIVGVVDSGPFAGQAAFAIAINSSTGVVSVEQYLSLDHPVNPDPNDPLGLGDNTVAVTVTATDGDGDPVTSGAIDISNNITFLDDGPNAAVNTGAPLDTLVLDETRPIGTEEDGDSSPAGLMTVQANFADNFIAPVNYGADGPGTTTYSFVLSGSNVPSGLYAIDPADISAGDGDGIGRGAQIVLNQSGNTITGSAGGVDYFTITIDPNTGVVTFTQLDNIWHANTGSDDDTSTLMANLGSLLVRQTVVDGDGDSDTADVDVSQGVFQIEDDGPIARNDVDEILSGGNTATGNVITGVGTNGGAANADDVGEDLPGRVSSVSSVNEPGNTDQDPSASVFEIDGEFGTLVLNADGSYTYTRFDGAPGNSQDVFTYTLIDADGDTETATLTINIGDAAPNLPDPALIQLDDDVVPGANGNVPDGPGDDNPDVVGQNVVNGSLVGSGGDGALTYNFTGVNTLPLGFSIGAGSDADTLLINQGGTLVMTIQLNQATGAFTVTQNAPIDHPSLDGLAGDNTENNLDFAIGVEVEDADGDVEPATITINVDDDTPVATVNGQAPLDTAVLDETRPEGTDTAGGGAPTGDASVTVNFADNFTTPIAYGADGPGSVSYALVLSANGIGSGLFALDPADTTAGDGDGIGRGASITLSQVGNVITGSAGGVDYFTITINPANGEVTFTQLAPIWHPTPGASFDEAAALNTAAAANIQVQQTVTDGDGDSTSASLNIGQGVFSIQDDGPDAAVNGTAPLDTIVLDESRPEGTDTAGGSAPTGDASSTANFADNFAAVTDYGADGAGKVAYSLFLSANGIASGLFALDPTDKTAGDGDGVGRGAPITLSISGDGLTITGSAGGTDYFTISIDANTGVVTFTQLNPIWHPTAPASFDEAATLTTANPANVAVVQTVTDADGDTDSASINVGAGVFSIQDDGPVTLGPIENGTASNNPADPTSSGELNIDIGSDAPGFVANITANNTGITSGGKALVTNFDPALGRLTAYQDSNNNGTYEAGLDTTAVYTLTVDPNAGADGEWVFDLITPLDPTVTDTPIGGSSSFGAGPTLGQILEDAVGNDLSVISGYHPTGSFNPATWLSTGVLTTAMVTSAGVNGSTAGWGVDNNNFENPDELIIFDFGAQALGDFDGDPAPPGPDAADYTPPATTLPNISFATYEFIGYKSGAGDAGDDIAYVVHYTDGTFDSGWIPAANIDGALWTFTADAGKFIADMQFFSGMEPSGAVQDLAPGKIDLVSVGVQTSDLDETISFNVTISDADGDQVSGSFSVNVADGNTPSQALLVNTFSSESTDSSSFSLLASDSQETQLQKIAANSNTLTLATAVAAAGLSGKAAAHSDHANNGHGQNGEFASIAASETVERYSLSDSGDAAVSMLAPEASTEASAPVDTSNSSSSDNAPSNSLDDSSAQAAPESNDAPAADDGGSDSSAEAAGPVAPTVAMVSAEALQAAANDGGEAQQDGSVEQIVAEALSHGNAPDLDAVLANLPGGNGALQAIAHMASPEAAAVSSWHMGGHGAVGAGFDMMFKMDVATHHQDAVQPVANG